MHTVFHDFRHALRRLRQARGFTTISVGILALGIGGNVLMFNLLKSTILAPLPYADADRLVFVWNHYNNIPHAGVSPPDFLDYRARNHSFSRIAAFTRATFNVTCGGDALRIQALRVTPEFLSTWVSIRYWDAASRRMKAIPATSVQPY